MKKLISLVIAAAVSVSVLGCAEKKTPPPAPPAGDAKPAAENPPATPAPEGGAAPAPEGKAP